MTKVESKDGKMDDIFQQLLDSNPMIPEGVGEELDDFIPYEDVPDMIGADEEEQ